MAEHVNVFPDVMGVGVCTVGEAPPHALFAADNLSASIGNRALSFMVPKTRLETLP